VGNYCYVAVCSAALGASAPTEGGKGGRHIVAAACLQFVTIIIIIWLLSINQRETDEKFELS